MSNSTYILLKIVKAILFIGVFVLLITWVTMGIWNFVMPTVINLPEIDWMQAAALLLLARLLMGGGHYGWNKAGQKWKNKMNYQSTKPWSEMTAEEKERVKMYWKQKCAERFGSQADATTPQREDEPCNE